MIRDDWQRLYSLARWKRTRIAHLRSCPLCVMCKAQGYTTAATVVDHIKAHKGDVDLFFDPDNLQSLCKLHHDSVKQAEEKGGTIIGCDKNGEPLDPSHHWKG